MSDRMNLEIGKWTCRFGGKNYGVLLAKSSASLRCRKSNRMLKIASRVNEECGFEES